jgi:hypothetical protein
MTMTTTTTTGHIPADTHDLFSNCSPEAKAVYANTYGLIWRDGGKNAATLEILNDHAVAFMAVIGSAQAWCDSLGPRPPETEAVALACARMFALLDSIREIDPQSHTLDRRALGARCEIDGINEIAPENYAFAAKQIREAVGEICFRS